MTDTLEELWSKFSLTEDEQSDIIVEQGWANDPTKVEKNCALGKILMRKTVNVEAMKNVFIKIWKLTGGLSVREVGDKLYLFYFDDPLEKDKALQKQPWSFNKSLMILKDFDGLSKLEEADMDWCPFWVQAHGLPLGLMNEKVGVVLGEALGDVEEMDINEDQHAWGHYLRMRVLINISKPFK